jgi:hypothetical protein
MAQRINVFGENLDISDLKVKITFVGDHMVTAFEIQFETGPAEDDRDTLFATSVYTLFAGFEDNGFDETSSSSVRIASERYVEWLTSVGGVILETIELEDPEPGSVDDTKATPL